MQVSKRCRKGRHISIMTKVSKQLDLYIEVRIEILCFCSCIHGQTFVTTKTATIAQIMK